MNNIQTAIVTIFCIVWTIASLASAKLTYAALQRFKKIHSVQPRGKPEYNAFYRVDSESILKESNTFLIVLRGAILIPIRIVALLITHIISLTPGLIIGPFLPFPIHRFLIHAGTKLGSLLVGFSCGYTYPKKRVISAEEYKKLVPDNLPIRVREEPITADASLNHFSKVFGKLFNKPYNTNTVSVKTKESTDPEKKVKPSFPKAEAWVINNISLSSLSKIVLKPFLNLIWTNHANSELPSTLVANHVSFMDIYFTNYFYMPSFLSKDAIETIPLVNVLANMRSFLFVQRGADIKPRQAVLQCIVERQWSYEIARSRARDRVHSWAEPACEATNWYLPNKVLSFDASSEFSSNSNTEVIKNEEISNKEPNFTYEDERTILKKHFHAPSIAGPQPILIFPEGTTTNGEYIIPFKRGAFVTKRPVKPILLGYDSVGGISSAYINCLVPDLAILLLTNIINRAEIVELPTLEPVDPNISYSDYAQAIREAMTYFPILIQGGKRKCMQLSEGSFRISQSLSSDCGLI